MTSDTAPGLVKGPVDATALETEGGGTRSPQRPPGGVGGGALRSRVTGALNSYAGVLVVLAVLVTYLTVTQENFLTKDNFINIFETNSVALIVATGLTFVLLVGGFDLSLSGTIALTATTLYELTSKTSIPVVLCIVIVISMAFALGFLVNGLLIGKVGLSFLVVTIATSYLFRGVAKLRVAGQDQSMYGIGLFTSIRSKRFLDLPLTVWIAIAVFVIGLLILRYTGFGRMVYATGGNPEAARLAGINTDFVRVAVFGIAAGLAGLASVVDVSRTTTASPTAQTGIELTVAAAVLLGGTSFMGGKGTLLGTLLGVMFLGILQNGLTLSSISPYWADVVSGVVLISAIGFDRYRNRAAAPG